MPDMYIGPSGYQTADKRFAPNRVPLVYQIATVELEGQYREGCPTGECDWCGYGIADRDSYTLWGTWTHSGEYNLDHTCSGCTSLIRNRIAHRQIFELQRTHTL